MTAMNVEFELRFAGAPRDVRKAFDGLAADRAASGAILSERVVSVYHDDARGTLARQGASLRVRKDSAGWTVVAKQAADGSGAKRIEVERPVSKPFKFAPLGVAAVDALLEKGGRLRRTGRVAVDRLSAEIRSHGARIEIAADFGEARSGGRTRFVSELEIELLEGPTEALFSLARSILRDADGGLQLRLAAKAETCAPRKVEPGAVNDLSADDARRNALARAGVDLERALSLLDLRRRKACKRAARALQRVIDAADFWPHADQPIRQLAEDARAYLEPFRRAERVRRLSRAQSAIDFSAMLVAARDEAHQLSRTAEFGAFRLLMLEQSLREPSGEGPPRARSAAIASLEARWTAVSSSANEAERKRALIQLAAAVRGSSAFFPKEKRRPYSRVLRAAVAAHEAGAEAQETCAIAAEAAAGQGPAAARAAGFIAGAAAAEAAARLAEAKTACDALLAAPRYWREEAAC